LADALEKSGEAVPPVLSYELGNYLYTVNHEYGDNWILESQAVQQKAVENYDRALAYDTYTEKSLSNQAGSPQSSAVRCCGDRLRKASGLHT
jgi:hypothetical protein